MQSLLPWLQNESPVFNLDLRRSHVIDALNAAYAKHENVAGWLQGCCVAAAADKLQDIHHEICKRAARVGTESLRWERWVALAANCANQLSSLFFSLPACSLLHGLHRLAGVAGHR